MVGRQASRGLSLVRARDRSTRRDKRSRPARLQGSRKGRQQQERETPQGDAEAVPAPLTGACRCANQPCRASQTPGGVTREGGWVSRPYVETVGGLETPLAVLAKCHMLTMPEHF